MQNAKRFAEFFKNRRCHQILVERCYIGNDKRTMGEFIESHVPIGEKTYSDFLEFYVGILLKSIDINSDIVWNIIKEIVSVGLLYYINDSKSPKELDDSARLSYDDTTSTQSNVPSNSESPSSLLHPSIDLSASSQSIESDQKAITSSKTFLNQESVSKSAYTPLSMNENVESHGSVTSPSIESLAQTSNCPNRSKRREPRIPRSRSSQIAIAYREFVFTLIVVDEILALSNDEQDSLYRCRKILNELINHLRTDLNKLIIGLSLPDQNPAPLVASKRTLEDQIFEYLTTNALHSEILLEILRDAKPVQEHLDNFRCQLKTIIRISRIDGTFKGDEGGSCGSWKILGSDGIECFKGSFPLLQSFLLNPTVDVLQKCGNENKRKLNTSLSSGVKRSRKNSQSHRQGNKTLDRIWK